MNNQQYEQEIKELKIVPIVLAIVTIILITLIIFSIPSAKERGYNQAINDSQINITNAYYSGLLNWQQSGKLAYLETSITGQPELKSITLKDYCEVLK